MKLSKAFLTFALISLQMPLSTNLYADSKANRDKALEFVSDLTKDQSIDIDIPVDIEVLAGINLQIDFIKRKVEKSQRDSDYYTRIDRARPKSIVGNNVTVDIPFYLYSRLHKEKQVIFSRQFTDHKEALTASSLKMEDVPYSLDQLKALPNLTLVSIPMILDFVPYGVRTPGVGAVSPSVGFSKFARGEFYLQIFKRSDDAAEIRLIEITKSGKNQNFKISCVPEITGTRAVNNFLARITGCKDIFEVKQTKEEGDTFAVSYVVDLNKASLAQAYQDLMETSMQAKKFWSAKETEEQFKKLYKADDELQVADITELERLSLATNSGVERSFKVTSDFEALKKRVKFGFNYISRHRADTNLTTSHVVVYDSQDNPNFFFNADHTKRTKKAMHFFGLKDNKKSVKNSFYLYKSDASGAIRPSDFSNFGVVYSLTDKDLTHKQQLKVQEALRRNFPDVVYNQIDWNSILTEERQKASISFQVVFKDNIVERVLNSTPDDTLRYLFDSITNYTQRGGLNPDGKDPEEDFHQDFTNIEDLLGDILYPAAQDHPTLGVRCNLKREIRYGGTINVCNESTRKEELTYKEKIETLLQMHDIPHFDSVFLDFYMRFYPQESLMDNLNVAFTWKSNKQAKAFELTFGNFNALDDLNIFRDHQGLYARDRFNLSIVEPTDNVVF